MSDNIILSIYNYLNGRTETADNFIRDYELVTVLSV